MVRWTASIPSPYDEEHARVWIESHEAMRAAGVNFPFAVVDREDGLVGCINLMRHGGPSGWGAVGCWTAAWARNRGVATEALTEVAAWGFRSFGLERVELIT